MSTFLVTNETIDAVVELLATYGDDKLADLAKSKPEHLGNDLLRINQKALHLRYGDTAATPGYLPSHALPRATVQLVASASCYLSQCSTGDVRETEPLILRIERARGAAALEALQKTDAYLATKHDLSGGVSNPCVAVDHHGWRAVEPAAADPEPQPATPSDVATGPLSDYFDGLDF